MRDYNVYLLSLSITMALFAIQDLLCSRVVYVSVLLAPALVMYMQLATASHSPTYIPASLRYTIRDLRLAVKLGHTLGKTSCHIFEKNPSMLDVTRYK